MWGVFVLSSVMTAGVVLYTLSFIRDKKLSIFLVTIVPILSLTGYLMLGQPDMPGVSTPVKAYQKEHYAALAARPMQVLLQQNSQDIGALRVMGKIYMRLDDAEEAKKFFKKALDVAKAEKSIFYDLVAEEHRVADARSKAKKHNINNSAQ